MTAIARRIDSPRSCNSARSILFRKYQGRIEVSSELSRSLVSYQGNRKRPYYRWFKYKEGFSAALVEHILERIAPAAGHILDPFAGAGAALFASRDSGRTAEGIELLPIGTFVIAARLAAERVSWEDFKTEFDRFRTGIWRHNDDASCGFRHIRITEGAFPPDTERDLQSYRTYVYQVTNLNVRKLFELAALCVLEAVSFTRKDGQYLRWDERAPRELRGKKFNKGLIPSFTRAISAQLQNMLDDMSGLELFAKRQASNESSLSVTEGSCLNILPLIPSGRIDLVITSPPYCNRYDYTRTYALELAYLGIDEMKLRELRQSLLSCTVENRAKVEQLRTDYVSRRQTRLFNSALAAFDNQDALQEVLGILDAKGKDGLLNNQNVPRMVRNYFIESSVVIHELARIVRTGGRVVMVNDNVQYAGEEVPVDLVLSDIAESAGFETEHIWTLGRGKGNSSQQMGEHGRNELRKCAYVWRRT